jgi:hypothetical protein
VSAASRKTAGDARAPQVAAQAPQRLPEYRTHQRGLPGIFEIIHANTIAHGVPESLSGISAEHLVALVNEASNMQAGAENGLRVVASLMSSHDNRVSEFDHAGTGWLVSELAEYAEQAKELRDMAESRLRSLGYGPMGKALSGPRGVAS